MEIKNKMTKPYDVQHHFHHIICDLYPDLIDKYQERCNIVEKCQQKLNELHPTPPPHKLYSILSYPEEEIHKPYVDIVRSVIDE